MKLLKGNKSGLTLIESLAVIGLAALVIAGALILFGTAQDQRRVTAETTNISNIMKRMEEVFSEDDITLITMSQMITAGVFTASMKVNGAGDEIYNSWNGSVIVTPQDFSTYDVEYQSVPVDEVCIDLVKATRKGGFDEISIGGTVEDITDINISDIIDRCSEETVGANYVTIIWSMTN
jgi:type II secretory pathway pseudopilin PulG